jgi:type III pantothenate kinase
MLKSQSSVIGKNTVSAIQSGIFFGYLGLIEGIVANISKEMGAKPFVIATGGSCAAVRAAYENNPGGG